MLFPTKMLRARIVIEPGYGDIVLEQIGKEGIVHIDTSSLGESPNEVEASRVKTLWNIVQKQMASLEIEESRKVLPWVEKIELILDHAEKHLGRTGKDVDAFKQKEKVLKDERDLFERAAEVKRAFEKELGIEKLAKELQHIRMRVGVVSMESAALMRLALKEKEVLVHTVALLKEVAAVAVLYESGEEDTISNAFTTLKVSEIPLEYFSPEAFAAHEAKEQQYSVDKEAMIERDKENLQQVENQLHLLLALEEAKSSLREEKAGLILQGWIPKERSKAFAKVLRHATVSFSSVEGEAPVLIRTPRMLLPFENLLTNFSYPRYGEVNPVLPFALSFLLLFGIMFGDIGHGMVLASLGLFVKLKSQKFRDLGQIYYLSGLSAAFFGLLYGSAFGVHDFFPCLLFHPIKHINETILFSIVIGVTIITLSFLLNMITAVKRQELSLMFSGEGSLLWFLAYWFIIGILVKSLVQDMEVTYEVIILTFILIIIFVQIYRQTREKANAVIDLFRSMMETVTNTISFLRVGAFALAHGALFMAVFSMAKMISEHYGEGIFYWMLIIIGNVVIIILEGVIVTIQTLRLEYYEFFKRFYKGGGTPYRPYTLQSKE